MIRTLALLPNEIDWSIALVGSGDEERRLVTVVKELKLEDRVSFLGYVPREQIAEIYLSHDAFVSLSENESMSVAALEALACELPCILSRSAATGLSTDLLINLIESNDAQGIAIELLKALRNLDSQSVRSKVAMFSPSDMARNYKNSMRAAISASLKPSP